MNTVIWFTGLSGSGKTTIALELKKKLVEFGKSVDMLDGDVVRNKLHKHLGFSREDIRKNNQLIAELANKKLKEYEFILVPIISPYKEDRKMVRLIIQGNFIELFINSSLKKCIERDVKGLYKKALSGEINDFIGVSDSNPYEQPEKPDIEVDTESLSIDESLIQINEFLKNKKLL